MKKILSAFDVAEQIYTDRLSSVATSKVDLILCETYISDIVAAGRSVDANCTPEAVLASLKDAIATDGANFYA
ncbi:MULTISPECIES: hypothetical protein [Sinorhizobium]|uniref:Uncharacterized protein n=2 Tax=Sinorhizobium TaxID=28105 RepID=A0A6N7LL84_SINTE|nr:MULTISPECIES: hypothetical protein [Sinorhizobium]MBB4189587.1 hypothetical protein [Sinorhizobium terangae]MCZ4093573.1 hypothetical protein [Sinorhizobium psoraleae]MQX18009.1 hypothetical protein [Sinorhizobium terangae]